MHPGDVKRTKVTPVCRAPEAWTRRRKLAFVARLQTKSLLLLVAGTGTLLLLLEAPRNEYTGWGCGLALAAAVLGLAHAAGDALKWWFLEQRRWEREILEAPAADLHAEWGAHWRNVEAYWAESLTDEEHEIAHGLAPEYEGTLPELSEACRALAEPKRSRA